MAATRRSDCDRIPIEIVVGADVPDLVMGRGQVMSLTRRDAPPATTAPRAAMAEGYSKFTTSVTQVSPLRNYMYSALSDSKQRSTRSKVRSQGLIFNRRGVSLPRCSS